MCDGRENPVKAKVSDSEDLISQLSDEILTQILSFLPTKTVIRTSVLSKRWSRLWTTVPNLELDVSDFLPRGEGSNRKRRNANFLDFVALFLRLNSPCIIETLELVCPVGNLPTDVSEVKLVWSKLKLYDFENHPSYPEEIFQNCHFDLESWVHLAERYKVNELSIHCSKGMQQRYQISLNSYKLENLVYLELLGDMPFNIPVSSISFPKLKTLFLVNIHFMDEYSVPNLINSCCPVLEELFVYSIDKDTDLSGLVITAKTLKQLELEISEKVSRWKIPRTRVDVPALEYLSLENVLITGNDKAGDLGALDEAVLDIYLDERNADISSENDLFGILRRVCNVKKLILSEATLVCLNAGIFPMYFKLTRLEIKEGGEDDFPCWEVLIDLLKSCPNLENLCFAGLTFCRELDDITEDDIPIAEDDIPSCLTRCLKTLELSCLHDGKPYIEYLGYFVKHSRVLEKMKVGIPMYCPNKREMKKKIFELPKGSPECVIEVKYIN